MARDIVFTWDHGQFPLAEFGDDWEPLLETVISKPLVDRLYQWSKRFDQAWNYEKGFVVEGEPQKLDAEFRVLADDLRKEGIEFRERPWWRDPEYM